MTTIGIVGGQLQGLEAAYLARRAGFETLLIDRDSLAPARALADEFHALDVLEHRNAEAILKRCEVIIPATENYKTLVGLRQAALRCGVPLALDLEAYNISSSKLKSNELFAEHGIPMPEPWPACGFPVIVKPSGLSGSAGVVKVGTRERLDALRAEGGGDLVIQKYLDGPSYSLEVLAHKGRCVCLQVTELQFDAGYDCKRVIAGPATGRGVEAALYALGDRLSEALSLSGIMDIEVIDDRGELKVLEIDARLPSQTPSAVYHSTGVNIIALLAEYWKRGTLPLWHQMCKEKRAVIYEHLSFHDGTIEVAGEHVLAGAQSLKVYEDKFSADVVIANFEQSPDRWVATAIYVDDDEERVWRTRARAMSIMRQAFKAERVIDSEPAPEEAKR